MEESDAVQTLHTQVYICNQNMYIIAPQKPETYKELKDCWNGDIMSGSVNEESPVPESRDVTDITGVHHVLAVMEEDQLAESLKT